MIMDGLVKYLKEDKYYEDLYDLWTVEECMNCKEFWERNGKSLDVEESKIVGFGLEYSLYFKKGERYRNRKDTIEKWIERDKGYEEKLHGVKDPRDVRCKECGQDMRVVFKDLYESGGKVLFFLECVNCEKRRGVFDDGMEYVSKGYKLTKEEMKEWDKDDVERKTKEKKEREVLDKFRAEYCLSEVEGLEYISSCDRIKDLVELVKEDNKKRNDPDYKQAMKLKKLGIVELEELLIGALENEKYIKLVLDKPEIDRYVIVSLTVRDADTKRNDYDSKLKLQGLLKKVLVGTNWRLMSEGVEYRLGILSCRLKGYEREEDLMKLMKSK